MNKRTVFIIYSVAVAIIIFGIGMYYTLRTGLYIGSDFYYSSGNKEYIHDKHNSIRQVSDSKFIITYKDKEIPIELEQSTSGVTFFFSDQSILQCSLEQNSKGQYILVNTKGMPLTASNDAESWQYKYCLAICKIMNQVFTTQSHWLKNVLGLVVYLLGILTILHSGRKQRNSTDEKTDKTDEFSFECYTFEKLSGVFLAFIGLMGAAGLY